MITQKLSACIATESIEESRNFYANHFAAKVTFDCGWYVDMQIGSKTSTIQFIASEKVGTPACRSAGLTLNFLVEDVDTEYKRLTEAGIIPISPIEDHPWGDRSFSVADPNGITLCIYSERDPSEEFRRYYK